MIKKLLAAVLILLSCQCIGAQKSALKNMPQGYTPEEVGRRMAYRFVTEKHNLHLGKWIGYPETFYWNGSIRYANLTGDKSLMTLLQRRFEHLFNEESALLPIMNHVDVNMFGSLPLWLYEVTGDTRYKDLGMPYADSQWECPETASESQKAWADKGYSWQTRLWIDDMYMIPVVQTQAYKVTGDAKYLDRTAAEMVKYLDELQRPNGLFYHAPDVPFYWSRGNGWMAAGMTEMLKNLPRKHPARERIMKGYLTMMNSLLEYRNSEGLWNQLLDEPEFWTETSGSAMFLYAMINGVKHGWLDAKTFGPVARKGWLALVDHINERNQIDNVCEGTNKKNSKQYYYDRRRNTGDYHGQGPVLWCVAALLEK